MGWLRKASVVARLVAMVGVLCAFIVGMAFYNYLNVKRFDFELQVIYGHYLLPVQWLNDARAHAQAIRSNVYALMLTDKDSESRALMEDISNRRNLMNENLKKYGELSLSPSSVKLLDEVLGDMAKARSALQKVTDLALKNENQRAYDTFRSDALPPLDEYNDHMVELADYILKGAREDNEYNKNLVARIRLNLLLVSVFSLFLSIAMAFYIARSIAVPLREMEDQVDAFSKGDLSVAFSSQGGDEVAKIGRRLGRMAEKMREVIGGVIDASHDLKESSQAFSGLTEEANASLEETRSGTEQVSRSAESLSAAGEEINASVQEVASGAATAASRSGEVAEQVESAKVAAESGISAVASTVKDMASVSKEIDGSAKAVDDLASKAERIQSIVGEISSIADQTNLLALNAAIEAARAGEHGRGFAVVAEEVRKLAEESNESSKNIAELARSIGEDLESVKKGARSNQAGASRVDVQIRDVEERIKAILDALESIAGATQDVAAVSQEQAASSEEIAETVQDMAEKIQGVNEISLNVRDQVVEITQASERLSLGAVSLAELADDLNSKVSFFRLGEKGGLKPL
ncbi:methyl-accepting chemotaxis protein [Dethiosulfovibrio salsuginis]|uniref:Methyl-accepting chemotaxis protein n=1 Tax=Dethiosulfovibrio salsuginis TaxID=561720 RepID=A0A1X7KDL4_9BACT|nr:HAMP domain-containing methyl-accepting chemotaxis protein [Dethiosulfovibrio salsuginis]SMG39332.1 methyl-accepting chemotaxis protein [Dethiosulfovibrio salsuginis]